LLLLLDQFLLLTAIIFRETNLIASFIDLAIV